jgi:EAL domain-containing protein (putative c-di-GMP-specific phosphodiesterase class I)
MMLSRFHASGIAVALDDFGMGHSSFDYLRQYPVSALKIDQGFVRELGESDRARQLVRSMVDLARNLGITSIAEGVEDASTLHLLEGMGCDRVQGYHIARPQPADALLASLVGN